MASEQEIANLLADWRKRLANYEQSDRALFMHVNDLEPGVLVIEQLEQQLAQEQKEHELAVQEWQRDLKDHRAAYDELQQQLAHAREANGTLAADNARLARQISNLVEGAAKQAKRENQVRALLERVMRALHYDIAQYDASVGIGAWTVHSEEEIRAGRKQVLEAISLFLAKKEQQI